MSETDTTDNYERARQAWTGAWAVAVAILLFVTLVIFKPAMPDRIVLLTGPEESAYHDLGSRYAEELRRRGLEVEVLVTEGARDNLRRLVEGGAAVAFAPSVADWSVGVDASDIVALGSVGYEPLWLFYRSDLKISRMTDLAGKRVVTEGRGTVSDHVAQLFVEKNGLVGEVQLQPATGPKFAQRIIENLAAKSVDAVLVTGDVNSPVVMTLLDTEGLQFLSIDRAEAYSALIPGITSLKAPEGVFDLARNLPERDSRLLAITTCLVTHENLHPAVVPMLLVAAGNVHNERTPFSTTVKFPSSDHLTFPLDPAARRYFNQGEVGLSRFLPYRVTRFLNHIGFLVLPLLTGLLVVLKAVPVGLRFWFGFRLRRMLKRLVDVEKKHANGDDLPKLLTELDRIDRMSAKMIVPLSTVHDYIDFRQFLHDMRDRVEGPDTTVHADTTVHHESVRRPATS